MRIHYVVWDTRGVYPVIVDAGWYWTDRDFGDEG